MTNMKNRFLKLFLTLGAAASLTACSTSIRENPCLIWLADNGPYILKYTAKNPSDGCATTAYFGGSYDLVNAQIYPQPDKSTLALLPLNVVDAVGEDGMRDPAIKVATGVFDNSGNATDDVCTVPTLSPAASSDGSVKYEFSNLSFIEDGATQGMAFKGDVKITADVLGACTSELSFEALAWPYYSTCTQASDCIPIPDPSQGRYVGFPLAPTIQTTCDKSQAAQDSLGLGADEGVCFFANPYPSLCPDGSLAGDSNCPIQ
jgi:hypothetical protein